MNANQICLIATTDRLQLRPPVRLVATARLEVSVSGNLAHKVLQINRRSL
ncbi:MAG: hypothetical protein MSG64_17810 [Pyrinomonadaceae bacterium MAG19_C2-C3]|nr:hypothetical protein [Pyrinomonadaceae bacterium MAG19_C2-C3]